MQYAEILTEFDLNHFKSDEEIKLLQDDYNFDLVFGGVALVSYVATSEISNRLAESNLTAALIGKECKCFKQVLKIQQARCEDKESKVIEELINSLK